MGDQKGNQPDLTYRQRVAFEKHPRLRHDGRKVITPKQGRLMYDFDISALVR